LKLSFIAKKILIDPQTTIILMKQSPISALKYKTRAEFFEKKESSTLRNSVNWRYGWPSRWSLAFLPKSF